MSHRPSKRRAIQNALGRLGWQARSKEVIALLADYGIEVSEGLVSRMTHGKKRQPTCLAVQRR
jgi:hypothetical protein